MCSCNIVFSKYVTWTVIKSLTLRLLMSHIYIYMEHLFLMFLDHTQWRSTVGRTPPDEWSARPEESYRLCCVIVCDLETSRIGAPHIYDISSLRVKSSYFIPVLNLLFSLTYAAHPPTSLEVLLSHVMVDYLERFQHTWKTNYCPISLVRQYHAKHGVSKTGVCYKQRSPVLIPQPII